MLVVQEPVLEVVRLVVLVVLEDVLVSVTLLVQAVMDVQDVVQVVAVDAMAVQAVVDQVALEHAGNHVVDVVETDVKVVVKEVVAADAALVVAEDVNLHVLGVAVVQDAEILVDQDVFIVQDVRDVLVVLDVQGHALHHVKVVVEAIAMDVEVALVIVLVVAAEVVLEDADLGVLVAQELAKVVADALGVAEHRDIPQEDVLVQDVLVGVPQGVLQIVIKDAHLVQVVAGLDVLVVDLLVVHHAQDVLDVKMGAPVVAKDALEVVQVLVEVFVELIVNLIVKVIVKIVAIQHALQLVMQIVPVHVSAIAQIQI